jgi:hypothetical protein
MRAVLARPRIVDARLSSVPLHEFAWTFSVAQPMTEVLPARMDHCIGATEKALARS